MFHIYEADIGVHNNAHIDAVFLDAEQWSTNDALKKWGTPESLKSLGLYPPVLHFEVREDVIHPDNYWTGAGIQLYSQKMLQILEKEVDLSFEAFPTELSTRKTRARVTTKYSAFRLLTHYALLAPESCEYDAACGLINAKFDDQAMGNAPPLFIDSSCTELVFIRDDLKLKFETAGISGCLYTTLDEFTEQSRDPVAWFKANQ